MRDAGAAAGPSESARARVRAAASRRVLATNGRARQRALDGVNSRAATDALLGGLRAGGFSGRAVGAFIYDATRRSVLEARKRPVAFAEATAVHVVAAAIAHPHGRVWITTSWIMAVTHLGMLEERTRLGLPNIVTIARGTLPAAEHRLGNAVPVLALVTDFVDGKIARRTGVVTRFGIQGDYLADAALWTWFILRHETSRAWQIGTFAAWAIPVAGLAAASFAKGGMVDLPRSRWLRPAAAMEVLIGARVVARLVARRRRRTVAR